MNDKYIREIFILEDINENIEKQDFYRNKDYV